MIRYGKTKLRKNADGDDDKGKKKIGKLFQQTGVKTDADKQTTTGAGTGQQTGTGTTGAGTGQQAGMGQQADTETTGADTGQQPGGQQADTGTTSADTGQQTGTGTTGAGARSFTEADLNRIFQQLRSLDPEGDEQVDGMSWIDIYGVYEEEGFDEILEIHYQTLEKILDNVRPKQTTQGSTIFTEEDVSGFDDFSGGTSTKEGFYGEVYKKSLQKEIFYKAQSQRSPKIKRFDTFQQFLPSTKAEGFRTTPLPSVQQFSEFAFDLQNDPQKFYDIFGKYPFSERNAPDWGFWTYFTSKYGKLTEDGPDKSSGIGTILILLRRNGHAQMVVPSITPIETSNEQSIWSPIAEFVSRPELLGFEQNETEAVKILQGMFSDVNVALVQQLSRMAKSFNDPSNHSNPTSGLQMLRYARSWKQSKASSLQRRMVMPILIFIEKYDETKGGLVYEFYKRIRGTAFSSPYKMDMQKMAESMDKADVAQGGTSGIPDDIKAKINEWASFVRNNPVLGAPMGRRSRRRVKRRR